MSLHPNMEPISLRAINSAVAILIDFSCGCDTKNLLPKEMTEILRQQVVPTEWGNYTVSFYRVPAQGLTFYYISVTQNPDFFHNLYTETSPPWKPEQILLGGNRFFELVVANLPTLGTNWNAYWQIYMNPH